MKNETINKKNNILTELKNSIKGIEVNYTQINLNRAILLLSIPMILELAMESTFALVDIYFVGKLGSSAIATVGLTETYMFLMYAIAIGMTMAVTGMVARKVGEGEKDKASQIAIQAIILAFIFSIPFTIGGIFYSKELLFFMGANEWAINFGYKYTQWMLGGNMIVLFLFVINSIFRGAGDAAISMRILWISNSINMLLDPIFIFGYGPIPGLGIEGAAIATSIGRIIGVIIQFYSLTNSGKNLKISYNHFKINILLLKEVFNKSLGGIGQMIIAMTSWVFLMRILASISSEVVAASTTVVRLMMFTLMPAWGLANAAATLVGQNLGAKKPDRAEKTVWKIGLYNMIYLVFVSIIYFTFSEELMKLFTNDHKVIEIGASWLKILSYSYFVYGWWMVSVQAYNGSGDTKTPTIINAIIFWLIQIPLSYILSINLNLKESGVFWSVFICETLAGIFTLFLFSRDKWKKINS